MAVYTIYDVERVFGLCTPEQKEALRDIPFSKGVLRECAGTHMLFPSLSLSLLDIRAEHNGLFHTKMDCWYSDKRQAFSRTALPTQWHLLRMDAVPKSLGKPWEEQCKLLLSDEEVPSAALIAFATVLHSGVSKELLFQRYYVRTSDVDSDGLRVYVGYVDGDGFYVSDSGDDNRYGALGLSSVKKF